MASGPVRFSVPESEVPNIKAVAQASADVLQELANALGAEKPALDDRILSASLAERTGLALDVVAPVVSTLCRLAFVQRKLDLSTDVFLQALATSLRELGTEQWSSNDAELLSERQENIARLLAPDGAIAGGAKAADLLFEQQMVFCKARTLTDMRPVFDEQAQRVQGFLPFHTLALTVHEGTEMREIHMAMDFRDLVRLRKQLERAEQKEKVLRQNFTEAGLLVIQTGAESDD